MPDFLDALRAQADDAAFPLDGSIAIPGLGAPVTVTRDGAGVPSIEAASLDDLWFAQGLVTAGERLAQLDLTLRAANGRLSEMFGERTFDDDRFVRLVGLPLAGAAYAEDWTDEDHAMHARFREGVRAWLAHSSAPPLEYQLLGMAPKLPEDPAAWATAFAYLAWGLSNNYEQELLRARIRARLGAEAVATLMPPRSGRGGKGSNEWAVSGAHTASGKPLLANDPHLLAIQPGVWLPIALKAPGYEARGMALTFSPGIVLGATPHHAWGATNATGDVQDLFVVGDGDVTRVREERITVLGETEPRVVEVRETAHGPILDRVPVGDTASVYEDVEGTFALRWVGHETGLRPSTVLRVAEATDFESFRWAVLQVQCPGQNWLYVDVDGHIGLQVAGRHPVRRTGDGTEPLPDHGWDGWIPDREMPWLLDPDDGRLVTANDGLLHEALTDHLISRDHHVANRARRIHELLEAAATHDAASFAAMQRDTVSLAARATARELVARVPEATTHLHEWDFDLASDSTAAAVWEVWTEHIARRALAERLGEDLHRAYTASWETWRCAVLPALLADDPDGWLAGDVLEDAYAAALAELGDPIPTWGELHRLRLAHPLAAIPGLEPLFVAVDEPIGGDEQTVAAAGVDAVAGRTAAVIPSVRMVWDLADPAGSTFAVPAGVSGNPASPHWNDQADAFLGRAPLPDGPSRTLTVNPA
ncbi:MAG TPA: penicillin acylase family protein [Actinomycetota bacterium]